MLRIDGRGIAALGLPLRFGAVREVGAGSLLGLLLAVTAVAAITAAGGFRWTSEPGSAAGLLSTLAFGAAFFLLPAAAEEVLFRGYPFQAIAEAWGARAALGISSVAFGLVHLGNPGATWAGALNVGLAGALLGALYLRTGSLWWAIGAHLGWNWAHGALADVRVSGLDPIDVPYVLVDPVGSTVISGGAFGPEGSLLTSGVLAAGLAWVWSTSKLSRSPILLGARPIAPIGRLTPRDQGSLERVEGSQPRPHEGDAERDAKNRR